jgi:hypothetical protein
MPGHWDVPAFQDSRETRLMTAAPPTHISWIEGPILLKYLNLINVTKKRIVGKDKYHGHEKIGWREKGDSLPVLSPFSAKFFQGSRVPVIEKNEDALLASSCKKLAQRGCYVIRSIFTDERAQRLDQRL